jgi:ribosomal protein S4E
MNKLFYVLLFSTISFQSFSQELQFESGRQKNDKKPELFHSMSVKSRVSSSFINDVMSYQLKQQVNVAVGSGFLFNGKVTAITNDAPGLTTISIQSSDVKDMVLSLSRVVMPDQTITYRGIVISKNHSDMLIFEKDPITGEYSWNKKTVSQMIAD